MASRHPGVSLWHILLAVTLLAPGIAHAQARYIPAYNALVRNLNMRTGLGAMGRTLALKDPQRGDTVTQDDLETLRASVMNMLTSGNYFDRSIVTLPMSQFAAAYTSATFNVDAVMAGIGNGHGAWTKVPAEYCSTRQAVYAASFSGVPPLWVHFDELARAVSRLRFCVPPMGTPITWTNRTDLNMRQGFASNATNWPQAASEANASYAATPPWGAPSAPTATARGDGVRQGFPYLATLERRCAYLAVSQLSTAYPHRVYCYAYAQKPAATSVGPLTSLFSDQGDSLTEDQWARWSVTAKSSDSSVVSDVLGSLDRPDWGPEPATGGATVIKGYTITAYRVIVEWTFPDEAVRRPPPIADSDDDGLVAFGCDCTTCDPEADATWRAMLSDTSVRIPMGISSGQSCAGVRVKAYFTEYTDSGRTQQVFSLDTSCGALADSASEGWEFAYLKRPTGADVVFPLSGTKAGRPIDCRAKYRLSRTNEEYSVMFPGSPNQVRHVFWRGMLTQVRTRTGTTDTCVGNDGVRGRWPGLTTQFADGSIGSRVTAVDSPALYAVVGALTNGLVRNVEYRWKTPPGTTRITYYQGSRGFRVTDDNGTVIRDTRLVEDPEHGAIEIWRGITTNAGVSVARREQRVQTSDTTNDWQVVTDTVTEGAGTSPEQTRVVSTAFQCFPWGWEPVWRRAGATDDEAQVTRWSYHTNADDTADYGNLSLEEHPEGDWTAHLYDEAGRECRTWRALSDSTPGDTRHCLETETVYAGDPRLQDLGLPHPGAPSDDDRPRLVIERLDGQEISRTYHDYGPDQATTVQCLLPGASFGATGNLATVTWYATNGTYAGRITRVDHPDGTLSLYTYALSGSRLTTTVATGSGSAAAVTNGTRRVTVTDSSERVLWDTETDIASGILFAATTNTHDRLGRVLVASNMLAGTAVRTEYGCCGPATIIDADGSTVRQAYDALKRPFATEHNGTTTYYTQSADGEPTETRVTAPGVPDRVTRHDHDSSGRTRQSTDPRGGVTAFSYATNELGGRDVTTTRADGGVIVERFGRDGMLVRTTGTAARAACYTRGVDVQGEYRVAYAGADTNAQEWVRTRLDGLGRTWRTEYPDGYTVTSVFDAYGRRVREDDGLVVRLTEYDDLGQAFRSGIDMDGNGRLDVTGIDRIVETRTGFGVHDGKPARYTLQQVYTETGTSTRVTVSEQWQTVDGRTTWNVEFGRTTRVDVVSHPESATRTETTRLPDGTTLVASYTNGLPVQVERRDATGGVVSVSATAYSPLGEPADISDTGPDGSPRLTHIARDPGGAATGVTVSAAGRLLATHYTLDPLGRQVGVESPDGNTESWTYTLAGAVETAGGSKAYPLRYGYTPDGRLASLATYRGGPQAEADVTRWLYDPRRGWLAARVYADGTTNAYAWRPDGRLASRTSARGITTRYAYDPAGTLTNVDYSDGSPSIGLQHDRLGRPVRVADALGIHAVAYTADGQVASTVEPHTGTELAASFDNIGRTTGCVVRLPGGDVLQRTGCAFDPAGRLAALTTSLGAVRYTYAPDGATVSGWTMPGGKQDAFSATHTRGPLGTETGTVYAAYGTCWKALTQEVDAFDHIRGKSDSTTGEWSYEQDAQGQLVSAAYAVTGQAIQSAGVLTYAYDTVGNRTLATRPDGRNTTYIANAVNQYVGLDMLEPGQASFQGTVYAFGGPGTVAMAGPVPTAPPPADAPLGLRHVALAYDADGNLTNDGRCAYGWDAENRLVAVTPLAPAPGSHRVRSGYDYLSRRAWRAVDAWDGSGWVWAETNLFVYDGWRMQAELRQSPGGGQTNTYVWGLDLSGTPEGAGGIGGLVAGCFSSASGTVVAAYAHDAIGNVVGLMDIASGQPLADYAYDPFGNPATSRVVTAVAAANRFGFGTKYTDPDTGLIDYGYRHYSPALGRWLSRDPLGEAGGVNVYQFTGNAPNDHTDPLGLSVLDSTRGAVASAASTAAVKTRVLFGTLGSVVDLDAFRPRGEFSTDTNAHSRCQFLITINGVLNTESDAENSLGEWRSILTPILGSPPSSAYVMNPSALLMDFVQAGFLGLGGIGFPSQTAAAFIKKAYALGQSACCRDVDIYIIAHSQGAAVLNQALPLIPANIKKSMRIVTLGAEQFIVSDPAEFGFLCNAASEADPIPAMSPRNWGRHPYTISGKDVPNHLQKNYRNYFDTTHLPPEFVVPNPRH